MVAHAVSQALQRFAELVRDRFGSRVREIVLFGSHARGQAHEDSDVDVLVVIDGLTHAERVDVVNLAYDVNVAMDDWVGLSPLARSTQEVTELRGTGRRIWREISTQGIAV